MANIQDLLSIFLELRGPGLKKVLFRMEFD